ncbi:MAG: TlpA family protein disulfide reductase [Flavobacteriales bacterium]|nr:TlpA family protein disulfide reductase [Flavobacteriales bacterium]
MFLLLIAACQQPERSVVTDQLAVGPWQMVLDLDTTGANVDLPFQFDLKRAGDAWHLVIHNQDEAIQVDSVVIAGDSILIRMPFFDSEFRGTILNPKEIQGLWYNLYKGPRYSIPFKATAGAMPRFAHAATATATDISGDWEVHFTDGEDDEPAIGIFAVENGYVKGSFATETGDLRFLEGITTRDSLFLSSFNGSQAFLFRAAIHPDSILGEFRSGIHWKQAWYAIRNPAFALSDDETLTKLDTNYPVDFAFPDQDGEIRAMTDDKYKGKVMVVEIMGTWCPNCLDEARMLHEFQEKYAGQGLQTVALSFERYPDSTSAFRAIRQFRDRLGINYDMLYAGMAHRDTVVTKLPFISQLKSYPTTLLIGRDGTVRRVITGIYGPGTGARYHRFKDRMENSIVELLREPVQG